MRAGTADGRAGSSALISGQGRQAASGPTLLLAHVRRHVLRAEALGQHLVDVDGAPALLVEHDRELEVLGQ